MTNQEIIEKLHHIKELQTLIDEASAEMESIKGEIKSFMGSEEELFLGEYHVRYKPVSSKRVDAKKLSAEHPDIYESVCRSSSYRRLTID